MITKSVGHVTWFTFTVHMYIDTSCQKWTLPLIELCRTSSPPVRSSSTRAVWSMAEEVFSRRRMASPCRLPLSRPPGQTDAHQRFHWRAATYLCHLHLWSLRLEGPPAAAVVGWAHGRRFCVSWLSQVRISLRKKKTLRTVVRASGLVDFLRIRWDEIIMRRWDERSLQLLLQWSENPCDFFIWPPRQPTDDFASCQTSREWQYLRDIVAAGVRCCWREAVWWYFDHIIIIIIISKTISPLCWKDTCNDTRWHGKHCGGIWTANNWWNCRFDLEGPISIIVKIVDMRSQMRQQT